ncbi:hypothetical protein RHECNPAF_33400101 [Rhizobium etli CNPAF512]|nr:hypothetical protein RHECNPAF_33400101 [Rhizobium etli CNPAF512]
MAFLIRQQFFEKFHGNVVAGLVTDVARLLVGRAGVIFAGQIGFQHFLDILADTQGRECLQVGMTFEEDDARYKPVGMVHLFDGFGAFLLGELGVAPILEQPIMNPILIDSPELEEQCLVKPLDDLFVAFQCPLSCFPHGTASSVT